MTRLGRILPIICGVVIALTTSCQRESAPISAATTEVTTNTELAFAEQAKAVRDGKSDTIRLDETLVTDQDLAELEGVNDKLQRINLSNTKLSDAALGRLAECSRLEQLRVASPRFTNDGLRALADFPRLKYLHLIGSPFTGGAVSHLKKLNRLSSLYLDDTELTLNDMRELINALPDTHIHFDGGHHRDDSRADVHAE
jgi:hypothetical protein